MDGPLAPSSGEALAPRRALPAHSLAPTLPEDGDTQEELIPDPPRAVGPLAFAVIGLLLVAGMALWG